MERNRDITKHFILANIDHTFAADPYPHYKNLRENSPLCFQPDGSVVVTRYQDVKQALGNPNIYSSDKRADFLPKFGESPLYEHHTTSIVFNDPPYHTRVRKLLGPFFAARVLREMETSIAKMVDTLLNKAEDRGSFDAVKEFALVIPLNLIGDLLGVPLGDREPLLEWAQSILGALEPSTSSERTEKGNKAVEEFKAYLQKLVWQKRKSKVRSSNLDVLGALIEASDKDAKLNELEILHNAIFILNAGHDTTGSLIANGVDLLCRFPAQRALLIHDPTLYKSAIEEMLRFESPLQIGNRRTTQTVTLGEVKIPAKTFLHLVIASANRDEQKFEAADQFKIDRNPNHHLAFSHGIHTCAGNSVARMEATIALKKLIERFPKFTPKGKTVRSSRARFRAVESLRLDLTGD
jgi:cytochrome P450